MSNTAETESWQLDNSYARLPDQFYSRINPVPASAPQLVVVNHALANDLGLTLDNRSDDALAQLFSGNRLPPGAEPIAQAYSGHQFGYFTRLGDGRAHLLGEHITPEGRRVDIQLKGSGPTPYGRRGDGRAALGPMLREYILGEGMHALGIPTSRGLAVVTTGDYVYRESKLPGAVFTRVAASHLRVGTFQHIAAERDATGLKQLADYAIKRHYPELGEAGQPYLQLLRKVMDRQLALVVDWLRVGFIHGVMNTDNVTISGETIDYGPCAFIDGYDPQAVFSSIDHGGRYAFGNQPRIVQWNIARFAEAILPLLHENEEQATTLAQDIIQSFDDLFEHARLAMLRRKLGLFGEEQADSQLIATLLEWMQRQRADYTNTFRELAASTPPAGDLYQDAGFQDWWSRWQQRLERTDKPLDASFDLMRANNPAIIPRNHQVEAALIAAEEQGDLKPLYSLLDALAEPYLDIPENQRFRQAPNPEERVLQTFCGT